MKEVKISVVIPTLNEERRIVDCLNSLKRQKFSSGKIEIILVDGNSEDKTVELSKILVDRVIVIKERNIAQGRNAGAFQAKGEIVAFADADTLVPEDWIQKIYDTFNSNKKIVGVYGSVFILGDSIGEKISKLVIPTFLRILDSFGFPSPIGSNMAVKTKAFKEVGGFNPKFITCEDTDLSKRLMKKGSFKFNPSIIVFASSRRIKETGYLNYCIFHLTNLIKFNLTGKSSVEYPPIR